MRNAVLGIADLFYRGGQAFVNSKAFTGVVRGVAKNGDHMERIYENGIIKVAKRCGEQNFVKRYLDGKVHTYSGQNLFVDSKDFVIKGKLGKCQSILDPRNRERIIRTNAQGELLSIFERRGDKAVVVNDLFKQRTGYMQPELRVYDMSKAKPALLATKTPYRTGTSAHGLAEEYGIGVKHSTGDWLYMG